MAKKEKNAKGSGRLKKKQVAQWLVDLFNEHPEKEYDVKDLFTQLKANNHPAKMIIMDALSDLVLDENIKLDTLLNNSRLNHAYHPLSVAVITLRVVLLVQAIAKQHRNALVKIRLKGTNKSFGNGIARLVTFAVH